MALSFKTIRGEVYTNFDILFGPQPITINDATLSKIVNRQGVEKTVKQWLLDDRRLSVVKDINGQVKSPRKDGSSKKPNKGKWPRIR